MNFQQRVLYTVSVALAGTVLVLLAWQIKDVLLIAFAGFVVAVFLNGCAEAVRRVARLPRGVALALAILVLVGLAVSASLLLLPAVIAQLNELFTGLPNLLTDVQATLDRTTWGHALLANVPQSSTLASDIGNLLAGVASTLSLTVNSLVNAAFIIVVGVFLAASPATYRRGLLSLVPREYEPRASALLSDTIGTLQSWLIGQAIAMSAVGVLTTVGLTVAGVPLALALGIIAGVLDLIPFFGPLMAAIPAFLIGLTNGIWTGVWAAVVSLLVQQLEGNVIQPLVQRRAVKIPPALLVLALTVMGKLFGFLGILVATPFAAVIVLLVKHLYVRDVLGKDVAES